MTSRERVISSLSHREPDKVPLDLGSTLITGIHVSDVYKRQGYRHHSRIRSSYCGDGAGYGPGRKEDFP